MLLKKLFGEDADLLRDRPLHLVFGANAVVVLAVALISPLLETLTGPFGVSQAEIGLIVTAVAIPAIVLIPVGGVLTDRYGRKRLLVAGLVIFGLGGSTIALTTEFRLVLGLRLVQGTGMSLAFPAVVASLRDLYDDSREATAQGLRVGVSGASQAGFAALAGVLVTVAWYYPFLLYAIAFPVALGIALWFDEPTDAVVNDENATGDDDTLLEYGRDVLGLMASRRVTAILLALVLMYFAMFSFLTYNSLIVVGVVGGGPQHAGLISAAFSLVFSVSGTQAGRITDHFESRAVPLVVANALVVVGLAVFAFAPTIPVAGIGAPTAALGLGTMGAMYRSLINGFAPEHLRGGLVSVGESLGWVGVTLTPVVLGLLIGLLEGRLGSTAALRFVVGGGGVAFGGAGGLCVLVAAASPPARVGSEDRLASDRSL